MKKVLHITNWYPNPWSEHEGIFIREQFNAFSNITNSKLVNIQVRTDNNWFKYKHIKYSENECGYYLLTRINSSKIIEALTTLLLLWIFLKEKAGQYDLIQVHIAYPLLSYYYLWKYFFKYKLIISEHWSAYHYNFYLPENTSKLTGIKRIFQQNLPVITVSNALLEDIRGFSGTNDFPAYVLPNIINNEIFYYKEKTTINDSPVFFIVNIWREIKNPFPVLEAFSKLVKGGITMQLRIGGYGPLLEEMIGFVKNNNLQENILFLGSMDNIKIAGELFNADAYLYSSNYETFSIVCAQALCCGVPLIGPPIPAILEYAGTNDMVIVKESSSECWQDAINDFLRNISKFNRKEISARALEKFSTKQLLQNYSKILDDNL